MHCAPRLSSRLNASYSLRRGPRISMIQALHSSVLPALRGKIKASDAMLFISFPVPRDPTAQVGLRLRRCSEKTPVALAQARKLFARRRRAGETDPALDCRRPPPDESRLSAVQAVPERYTSRKPGLGNGHRPART